VRFVSAYSRKRESFEGVFQVGECTDDTDDIENVYLHEASLQMLGFGPNFLHLIEDSVLRDVGFTPGDMIRLKQYSQQW
jgi:hypothetical protein